MVDRFYFFFAAFFAGAFLAAAFFAGAFFAAFLVAILPILPFRWFASMSAIVKLQLNECIDSCYASVKKKTYEEWKNGQQFFSQSIAHRFVNRKFSFIGRGNESQLPHPEAINDFKNFFSMPSSRFLISLSGYGWRSFASAFNSTAYARNRPSTPASTCVGPSSRRSDSPAQTRSRHIITSKRISPPFAGALGFYKGWSKYRAECPSLRSSTSPAIESHPSNSVSTDRPRGGECA
jgi:hypothetical protein